MPIRSDHNIPAEQGPEAIPGTSRIASMFESWLGLEHVMDRGGFGPDVPYASSHLVRNIAAAPSNRAGDMAIKLYLLRHQDAPGARPGSIARPAPIAPDAPEDIALMAGLVEDALRFAPKLAALAEPGYRSPANDAMDGLDAMTAEFVAETSLVSVPAEMPSGVIEAAARKAGVSVEQAKTVYETMLAPFAEGRVA
ncbi:hypothetical protein GBZ26_11215 [Azospirillum formosense]|uniref:DUF768 domain-containing protein n=1 Tax=Azospirillum formosense TaxID=861533 RepID=A0ABX2KUJ5_9PROT|nr:hypothetical protein [Azospirillum formosense]MBY3756699.1 hypothetical protein [Azospirillum formosense]NUB19780.1 hypothetical protein [Azospirillum formosense]